MSIFSGIYNVGIGGGALLGNLIIIHYGLKSTGYTGAIVAFSAPLVMIFPYIMKKNKMIFN